MGIKNLSLDKPKNQSFLKKDKPKAKPSTLKKKIIACISKGLKNQDEPKNIRSDQGKISDEENVDASDDIEEALRSALKKKFFPNTVLEESRQKFSGDGDRSNHRSVDLDEDDSDESHVSDSKADDIENQNSELTKNQRKRQKKRELLKLKRAAKAAIPKPEPQEPPTSSSIVLPTTRRFVPEFDTDEKRLKAACARLAETSNHTLQIRPIPRPCSPGLLKDLCPLAIGIRVPAKRSARYAFFQFRNNDELVATQNFLANKLLNGKTLKVVRITSEVIPNKAQDQWLEPGERQMSDFKWNVLFVTHLPRATTRFDLAQVFRKATSIHMPTFDDGSCKGFCTLTYRTKTAALHAFETRHGTYIRGSSIYVNFALKDKHKLAKQMNNKRPLNDPTNTHPDPAPVAEAICTDEPKTKIKKSKLSSDTFDPSFVIQSSSSSSSSAETIPTNQLKKKSKVATNLPDKPHPKLTSKHQFKYKGMTKQSSTSSALDALLKPSASSSKPKKDRSKSKGHKFKSNKHR